MKVLILCGGRGTRLREETEYRPKPMVPIGGRPILWHIMKYYAHFGHNDFIICVGYKGDMIKEFFRNYRWNVCDVTLSLGSESRVHYHDSHGEEDWQVTLAETGLDSGTAHRIKRCARYLSAGEPFLLTYGDGLSSIDISAAIEEHQRERKLLTLSAVHPAGRFGALAVDVDGRIRTFQEKPQMDADYVNGGFMVVEPAALGYFGDDPTMMLERAPLQTLLAADQLHCYRHEGWWQPMDTFQEMQYLNDLWDSGKAPWKVWS